VRGALRRNMGVEKMPTKDELVSFEKDKAVQDNITESWLCVDCGVNTAPGLVSGPETRVAFALGAKTVEQTFTDETEVYHVKDAIWKKAGMRPWNGCLCIGCLEKRLERQLQPKGFARHDDKVWSQFPCTERLLDRRGFRFIRAMTDDGEREFIADKETADEIAAEVPPGELPRAGHSPQRRDCHA
jgi:hypothetical protein